MWPWGSFPREDPRALRGGMLAQDQEEREEHSEPWCLYFRKGGDTQEGGQAYVLLDGLRDDRRIDKHL